MVEKSKPQSANKALDITQDTDLPPLKGQAGKRERVGNAVFMTKLDTDLDESVTEYTITPSRASRMQEQPAQEFVQYKEAAKEETFEELEDRIEGTIYEVNKEFREGQKECMLIESEMRSLQFKVHQETQSMRNQIQDEINQLWSMLGKSTNDERCQMTFLEGQMGQLRAEANRDYHVVNALNMQSERLSQTMGTDNDFYEIIPGYTKRPDPTTINETNSN